MLLNDGDAKRNGGTSVDAKGISGEQGEEGLGLTLAERLQKSVDYMESHYNENVGREQLAAIAGLHPDYYTRAFKRHYVMSPIHYLANIRMRHAKSRLLLNKETSQSIAYSLGFNDEFYFSRKFKAQTGLAPARYVQKIRRGERIASLNHLTTGHLLALGVTPYAAILNRAFQAGASLHSSVDIGQFNPELDKLAEAAPELILTRGNRDEIQSGRMIVLNQIAPTMKLEFQEDWRSHLQAIARIINREREAANWLECYDDKASRLKKAASGKLGSERVLIVGVGTRGLYLFGLRNLGGVVYHDLGLEMPDSVAHIAHYQRIQVEQLEKIEAERIVLASFQYTGKPEQARQIRRHVQALTTAPEWLRLPAVRKGHVLNLIQSGHLYTSYNAWSHDQLLNVLKEHFVR